MDAGLRLGLVGCGAIAERHHDAIDRWAERTTVTATVDPDRARAEPPSSTEPSTPSHRSTPSASSAPPQALYRSAESRRGEPVW